MLYLCFTCDHELFFGKNYLFEEEVLISPTCRLLDVLESNNVKATLFTDVCSVLRYKQLGLNEYPAKIETQLRTSLQRGHDVQLHIHPHWLKSEYINGCWNFDASGYQLQSFGFEGSNQRYPDAGEIIKSSKEYLEALLGDVDPNYRCIAYRAGGLCLQPEKELLLSLKKNGIAIDSSVIKGGYVNTNLIKYNYLDTPESVNWWMSPKTGARVAVRPDTAHDIFEIPIGSYYKKPLVWLISHRNVPMIDSKPSGIGMPFLKMESKLAKRLRGYRYAVVPLSLDFYCSAVLIEVLKNIMKENDCVSKDCYLSIICHPKGLKEAHLNNIDTFIKKVTGTFPEIRFATMRDIFDRIAKKST